MKDIIFEKSVDPKKRLKNIVFSQVSEDKESITRIRKTFAYRVATTEDLAPSSGSPEVFMDKAVDSKKGTESFDFRVVGSFLTTHKRLVVRIHFEHTLHIEMQWKNKIFSPKKSVVLAEE